MSLQSWPEVSPGEKVRVVPLRPCGEAENPGQDGGQEGLGLEAATAGGDGQGLSSLISSCHWGEIFNKQS